MARKPKAQLHPDVAAALPMAIAALDNAPAPVGRDRTAQVAAISAKAPRRPKQPTPAAAASAPEGQAPKRREPKRRTPQPDGAPAETAAPGHEEGPPLAGAAGADPVPMDTASAAPGDGTQPPLPGLHAPSSAQPAAQWDRATDTVRFDWPAIERTAAANGPNQGMARLLLAARAEGANSRWPL